MLHAWKFSCIHPRTDQEIEFTAGLPDFFRDSVNSLNSFSFVLFELMDLSRLTLLELSSLNALFLR